MTRDEAIAISIRCRAGDANRTPNQVKALYINAGRRIDSYVALGILALDEPKSYADKIEDAMSKVRDTDGAVDVSLAFESAGLRIIEK
jgi:hypothetical protein